MSVWPPPPPTSARASPVGHNSVRTLDHATSCGKRLCCSISFLHHARFMQEQTAKSFAIRANIILQLADPFRVVTAHVHTCVACTTPDPHTLCASAFSRRSRRARAPALRALLSRYNGPSDRFDTAAAGRIVEISLRRRPNRSRGNHLRDTRAAGRISRTRIEDFQPRARTANPPSFEARRVCSVHLFRRRSRSPCRSFSFCSPSRCCRLSHRSHEVVCVIRRRGADAPWAVHAFMAMPGIKRPVDAWTGQRGIWEEPLRTGKYECFSAVQRRAWRYCTPVGY